MAGLVFYFEPQYLDVMSGNDVALEAWNITTKICNVIDEVIVINQTGQSIQWVDQAFTNSIVTSLDFSTLVGHVAQFVTSTDGGTHTMMHNLNHGVVDWYCFGPANGWQGNLFGDTLVEIHQEGTATAHAVHVAPAVVWDICRWNMQNP